MNIDKLITSIQSVFGIAKGELMISLALIIGVAIGSFVDYDRTNLNDLGGVEMQSNASAATTFNFGSKVEEYEVETETETVNTSSNDITLLNQKTDGKKPQTYNSKKNDSGIVGKININTASKLELKKLKGIGEKTAQKIIKYRKKSPFKTIEDIKKVKGIGPKKFEKMKKHITV